MAQSTSDLRSPFGRVALALAAVLALVASSGCREKQPAPAPTITAAVNGELARVEAVKAAIDPASLPEFARDAVPSIDTLLESARSASSPRVRLYRLRDAAVSAGALSFLGAHHATVADQESLRKLWESEAGAMSIASPRSGGTILERALAQGARNRALKLHRASLPYGKASGVDSGLYYLGEAHASLEFAKFVESLPVDRSADEPSPHPAAVASALASLENELVTSFEKDKTNRAAIVPSAMLKEARELEAQGFHDAAALSLMEARLAVSRAKASEVGPDTPVPGIPATANEASLTSLFAGIARQRGAKIQRAVVNDVLPFYATLFDPAAPVARDAATVVVTLVRWPYT